MTDNSRESELFRLLAENTSDLITLYDFEGRRVYASPSCERVLGPLPVTPLGSVHPDDQQQALDACKRVRDSGAALLTFRHAHADGSWRWLETSGSVVTYRGAPHVLAVTRDVTDRRRVEEERTAAEQRFRVFVDHATDGLFLFDAAGTIVDVNRRACENLGYSREELIGKKPGAFSAVAAVRMPDIFKRLAADKVLTIESVHRRKDGSTFPVEVRLRSFEDQGQGFGIALVRDITDSQRAERELVESHKLLNAVVEGTSDVVFVKDLSGRYLMVNGAAQCLLGCGPADMVGRTVAELWDAQTAEAISARDRLALELGSHTFEEILPIRGEPRTFVGTENVYRDAAGNAVGLVGILRDITQLKQLEEQFRQAQKMEAVGRLAGGIAHDFNNLLMVINAYTEMLLAELEVRDPNREMVEEIGKAGDQAATLTRQLLAFSRKQVLQPRVLDISGVLRQLAKLLQRLLGETITLTIELGSDLGLVRVDPGLFEQAVTNLVVNARDAMPRGGTITVVARNVELGATDARAMRPGSYVFLGVRDTGHGMEPAVRARVFEPFFTTKEIGRGTGLGLAMVYGFVKQSGGHIDVESAPNEGACFQILLPRVFADVDRTRKEPADEGLPEGSETVLLVEDEATVRRVTRIALESLGYTVLEAGDGNAARAIAASHAGPVHVMLSDVVMPAMSGPEVAALVTAERRDIRVIFMSGYSQGTMKLDTTRAAFLQKPFRIGELARKLREVLDR